MRMFKKGKTPLRTVLSEDTCERKYKYVYKSTPYKNLGGYERHDEVGVVVTHHLDAKKVVIGDLGGRFSLSDYLYFYNIEVIDALISILEQVRDSWDEKP